jgi:hypothetical protein
MTDQKSTMEFRLRIRLGNDAMRTADDIRTAVKSVAKYLKEWRSGELPEAGDNAPIRDSDGKPVGNWEIAEDASASNPLADASNLATVLAALRLFQRTYEGSGAEDIYEAFPEYFEPVDGEQPMPLGTEDIDTLCEQLNFGDGTAPATAEPGQTPTPRELAYINAAHKAIDGGCSFADEEIEIDDAPDCKGNYPKVSEGADGAFVSAWVWIENEDAGICRMCGAIGSDDGEDFDGLCKSCADKTQCNGDGCDTTVNPSDPYYATPCGTYCSEHMREHAQTCEVCRKQFPELAS